MIIHSYLWDEPPTGIVDSRWNSCEAIELRHARTNEKPVHSTLVQFVVTARELWVRFLCTATDIQATMSRYKDKVWQEGAVEIYLQCSSDSYLYEFQLSPIGTFRDLRVKNPGTPEQFFDDTWSCQGAITEARINRNANGDVCGWDGVFGIPWEGIQPSIEKEDDRVWHVGAYRIEYHPEEFSALAMDPFLDAHDKHFLKSINRLS